MVMELTTKVLDDVGVRPLSKYELHRFGELESMLNVEFISTPAPTQSPELTPCDQQLDPVLQALDWDETAPKVRYHHVRPAVRRFSRFTTLQKLAAFLAVICLVFSQQSAVAASLDQLIPPPSQSQATGSDGHQVAGPQVPTDGHSLTITIVPQTGASPLQPVRQMSPATTVGQQVNVASPAHQAAAAANADIKADASSDANANQNVAPAPGNVVSPVPVEAQLPTTPGPIDGGTVTPPPAGSDATPPAANVPPAAQTPAAQPPKATPPSAGTPPPAKPPVVKTPAPKPAANATPVAPAQNAGTAAPIVSDHDHGEKGAGGATPVVKITPNAPTLDTNADVVVSFGG
jgi:hypothetical protein